MSNPIYLNCAASSFPKPEAVLQCVRTALLQPSEEAGRSSGFGYSGERCKQLLADLIHCTPEELYFTSGATESANLIIGGLDMKNCHILATATEHNSILRPLYNHPDHPEITIVPCDENGAVSLEALESSLRPDTRYLFVNHCSNVTGYLQDLHAIGDFCHRHGIFLIADASQSLGCTELDVQRDQIDSLIFTGHKNLFGLTGTGGYYLRKSVPLRILKTGGTGTDSLWLTLPANYQNREPGTPNHLGITSLAAGTAYLQNLGIKEIQQTLSRKRKRLLAGLQSVSGIRILHASSAAEAGPVVSLISDLISPSDLGYILSRSYGITLRTGYHCCPCIHEYLHTPEGTVRISFSILTPDSHLDACCNALLEILKGVMPQ